MTRLRYINPFFPRLIHLSRTTIVRIGAVKIKWKINLYRIASGRPGRYNLLESWHTCWLQCWCICVCMCVSSCWQHRWQKETYRQTGRWQQQWEGVRPQVRTSCLIWFSIRSCLLARWSARAGAREWKISRKGRLIKHHSSGWRSASGAGAHHLIALWKRTRVRREALPL